MIFDCHVHLAAAGSGYPGNRLAPAFRDGLRFRAMLRQLGLERGEAGAGDLDARIREGLCRWLGESGVERAVVLALDGAHGDDGSPDPGRTLSATDNDYVADLAAEDGKILFGASIHPYRRDALEELRRVAARGACLVKWLPSAQNIRPDDPRCFPFYEALAALGMPLLSHTGCEHTLAAYPDAFNAPLRLVPALERGVTVIAAHCGTRLFLHERSWFGQWRELALRHPNLYGDLAAFLVHTRIPALAAILRCPELCRKVLYGSDFPAPAWPFNLLGRIGIPSYLRLRRIRNPFDRSRCALEAAGAGPDIFSRAGEILRL
jgi:predicted TIM-barrel fold metal-dependent hydrolase